MMVLDYCCQFLFSFFFFKQKTAYDMRISDWSSDVCSSDLRGIAEIGEVVRLGALAELGVLDLDEVADVGGATDARARAQAREGTEHLIVADLGALQLAEAADPDAVADADPGAETDARLHRHVPHTTGVRRELARPGVVGSGAGGHRTPAPR